MSKYPKSEYGNTRNMSMRQQNEAKYLQSEYRYTQNMSMAGKLIRAQGEQIRRMTAEEYLREKMRSDARGDNRTDDTVDDGSIDF